MQIDTSDDSPESEAVFLADRAWRMYLSLQDRDPTKAQICADAHRRHVARVRELTAEANVPQFARADGQRR